MPKKDSITLNILGEDKVFSATVAEAGMSEEDVEELVKDKANLVNGVVPEQELPSYVDDVVEYSSQSAFPQQGEAGKIYLAIDTGYCYRWSGSEYVQVAARDNVAEVNDYASLPQQGQNKVIYITKDTNKQYRWNGTSYDELSEEDEIEVIEWQTSTPLTDMQIVKAKRGKLCIYTTMGGSAIYYFNVYSITSSEIIFATLWSVPSSGASYPVAVVQTFAMYVIRLSLSTKLLGNLSKSTGITTIDGISGLNFFDTATLPSASGKKVVRDQNLRKTQDMMSDVYDSTKTYALKDVVIYNNELYECTTAINVAEAWNSAHWTKRNISELIHSIPKGDKGDTGPQGPEGGAKYRHSLTIKFLTYTGENQTDYGGVVKFDIFNNSPSHISNSSALLNALPYNGNEAAGFPAIGYSKNRSLGTLTNYIFGIGKINETATDRIRLWNVVSNAPYAVSSDALYLYESSPTNYPFYKINSSIFIDVVTQL